MLKPLVTLLIGLTTGTLLGTFFKRRPRQTLFAKLPAKLPEVQPAASSGIRVVLNFDLIETVYNLYGKDGVYAYLVDNNIAKDYRHGRFIIDHIFLPEYKRRNAVQQQSEIIEQPLS